MRKLWNLRPACASPGKLVGRVKRVCERGWVSCTALAHEPQWPNVGEKLVAKDRRINIATYPTIIDIIRDSVQPLPPHFFDCFVIDERGFQVFKRSERFKNDKIIMVSSSKT